MATLRPEPPLFDLQAWLDRLAELRADALQDDTQAMLIEHAEAHVAAIRAGAEKQPGEAL